MVVVVAESLDIVRHSRRWRVSRISHK